jgi:hypothetical protein
VAYLPAHAGLPDDAPSSMDALPHERSAIGQPGVAPLSPLDARSELRMTRALRRIDLDARPETIRTVEQVASTWATALDRTSFAVTATPTSAELAALEDALIPDQGSDHRFKTDVDAWFTIDALIVEAVADIEAVRRCPVCARGASFEVRDDFTFWCGCADCGTRWGIRSCADGHRYPVVLPGGAAIPHRLTAGWVTETLGSFGVAMPCLARQDLATFVCPECRVCPDSARRGAGCPRCHEPLL